MAAEIEFPLTGEHLRKRAVALRAFIDGAAADPEFELEEDESILDRVFTQDELEWIEENEEKYFIALQRVDDDFNKLDEASAALHASVDAVEAHAVVVEVADADEELDAEEGAQDDDPDGDVEEED